MMSSGIVYGYYSHILKIDEEDFDGHGALLQEGLFASFHFFWYVQLPASFCSFWQLTFYEFKGNTFSIQKDGSFSEIAFVEMMDL